MQHMHVKRVKRTFNALQRIQLLIWKISIHKNCTSNYYFSHCYFSSISVQFHFRHKIQAFVFSADVHAIINADPASNSLKEHLASIVKLDNPIEAPPSILTPDTPLDSAVPDLSIAVPDITEPKEPSDNDDLKSDASIWYRYGGGYRSPYVPPQYYRPPQYSNYWQYENRYNQPYHNYYPQQPVGYYNRPQYGYYNYRPSSYYSGINGKYFESA